MKYRPLISIIIPVYNGSNYLAKAIDSALAQTYTNFEIIVVNDGSNDGGATREVALSYGDKIRYFEKENGGVSSALNKGISEMRGEYFSWLSHDDEYFPNKLEVQVELLNKNGITSNDKVILHGSGILMNADGEKIIGRECSTNGKYNGQETFIWSIKNKLTLNGLSLLIPKRAFDEVGGFNEELRYLQDATKWEQFMFAGYEFVFHLDKIVKSRVHLSQVTVLHGEWYLKELKKLYEYELEVFSKNFEEYFECIKAELLAVSGGDDKVKQEQYLRLKQLVKTNGKCNAKLSVQVANNKLKNKGYNFARKIYHKVVKKR